ncbi:GNAT family N-acetyltransferase [Pseudoalteromonas sp. MMG012]|uniref:GNAT family N-acetyltransferase n=1 Tax=Pseudoalteromonas sp. MMG012 TaxID=2822686 RepID=UPI001FFC9162|nr:GNAT family N-acetyltransferase [Pseudoalteromonas sp. MMG012]
MQQDNVLLVVEENENLIGMIELKAGGHVAMLFVDPEFQNNGVGRALLNAVLAHVNADILTVSASLTSFGAYQKYGFNCVGKIQESSGLVYQPMELCM